MKHAWTVWFLLMAIHGWTKTGRNLTRIERVTVTWRIGLCPSFPCLPINTKVQHFKEKHVGGGGGPDAQLDWVDCDFNHIQSLFWSIFQRCIFPPHPKTFPSWPGSKACRRGEPTQRSIGSRNRALEASNLVDKYIYQQNQGLEVKSVALLWWFHPNLGTFGTFHSFVNQFSLSFACPFATGDDAFSVRFTMSSTAWKRKALRYSSVTHMDALTWDPSVGGWKVLENIGWDNLSER